MFYIKPLLFILFYNLSLTIVFKKTFGKCIPLTFIISTLIIYISGYIFKMFNIGFLINILISLSSIFIIIYRLVKKESIKKIKENYFTKAFYYFLIISILFILYDLGRGFSQWDELSHWGVMVKEMLRLDNFYSIDASTLMVHKDYPPFVSLYELLWIKLAGIYREDLLIQSIHIFELSLFIPFINETKKFNVKKLFCGIIFALLIFYLITLFDAANVINTIYTDIFIMILFAYSFSIITNNKDTESNFNLFAISISLIALMLTKQMGLPLFLIIIFYYFLDLIIKKIKFNKNLIKKLLKICLVIIIIPLLFYKSWGIYIDKLNIKGQFQISDISLSKIKDIVLTKNIYQHKVLYGYVNKILNEKVVKLPFINITYFNSISFILLLLFLIRFFNKKQINNKKILSIAMPLFIGTVGYGLTMLLLYLFCFGEYEALIFASYNRYMSTFIIGELSIIIMLFINLETSKLGNIIIYKKLFLIVLCLTLLVDFESFYKLLPSFINNKNKCFNDYKEKANLLMSKVPNTSKVFFITSGLDNIYYIKYYANPIRANIEKEILYMPPKKEELTESNVEIFINKLKEYEYVYLLDYDSNFIKNYNYLFMNKDQIKINNIYKIEINNTTLKLKRI